MAKQYASAVMGVLLTATIMGLSGCSQELTEVSFSNDVRPILDSSCMECHKVGGEGQQKSGLNMTTYDSLMKGTQYGPVVKPGDAFTSAMIMLVEGRADPSLKMPHGGEPLPDAKIAVLKAWIDQGAKNN